MKYETENERRQDFSRESRTEILVLRRDSISTSQEVFRTTTVCVVKRTLIRGGGWVVGV